MRLVGSTLNSRWVGTPNIADPIAMTDVVAAGLEEGAIAVVAKVVDISRDFKIGRGHTVVTQLRTRMLGPLWVLILSHKVKTGALKAGIRMLAGRGVGVVRAEDRGGTTVAQVVQWGQRDSGECQEVRVVAVRTPVPRDRAHRCQRSQQTVGTQAKAAGTISLSSARRTPG
jgi:hypothetical protein